MPTVHFSTTILQGLTVNYLAVCQIGLFKQFSLVLFEETALGNGLDLADIISPIDQLRITVGSL